MTAQRRTGLLRKGLTGLLVGGAMAWLVFLGYAERHFFVWVALAQVRAGAQWLANMSSDTWLQEMALREQYADFCALRAVETRRWVVRSSPVGLTGFCSPMGQRVWAPPDVRGVWVGAIRPLTHQTPYVCWGDFWVYGCALVLAWGIAKGLLRVRGGRLA